MIIGRKLEIVGLLKASHISLWGMPLDTFSLALFYLFLRTVAFYLDSAKKNALSTHRTTIKRPAHSVCEIPERLWYGQHEVR